MEAAGYPANKIYIEGAVGLSELLKAIAGRPNRIGVTTIGRLGITRNDVRSALLDIISLGSAVHEVMTGRIIATASEAAAAAAAFDAAAELAGDARGQPPEEAARRGRIGGEARARIIAAERMPKTPARAIWKAPGDDDNAARIAKMPGWTEAAAYRAFGKRGVAKGRPRKDRT